MLKGGIVEHSIKSVTKAMEKAIEKNDNIDNKRTLKKEMMKASLTSVMKKMSICNMQKIVKVKQATR